VLAFAATAALMGSAVPAGAAGMKACASSRIHHTCAARLHANWRGEVWFRVLAPSLAKRTPHVEMRQTGVGDPIRRIGTARVGPRGVARFTWDAPRRYVHGTFAFRFVLGADASNRVAVTVPA
jgi:hypothetical protein